MLCNIHRSSFEPPHIKDMRKFFLLGLEENFVTTLNDMHIIPNNIHVIPNDIYVTLWTKEAPYYPKPKTLSLSLTHD